MTVHLFGGVWSISCSKYGLKKTAEDNSDFDSLVVRTVERNFYVDDCLKSVETRDSTAIRLVDQLRKLLLRGDFKLTKCICNSRAELERSFSQCKGS